MAGSLLISGGLVWSSSGPQRVDLIISGGLIQQRVHSPMREFDGEVVSAHGLWVLPGVIDSQVHFREPGLEHKENLESGSLAALKGGVTTFLEMPNTSPATTSVAAIEDKLSRAEKSSYVNFGFFMGATKDNLDELIAAAKVPGCCGIKIFLGSSTGDLLLYDREVLHQIFSQTTLPISIHSEDESRLVKRKRIRDEATSVHDHELWRDHQVAIKSTQMVVDLARKCKRRIHILHISTGDEIHLIKQHKEWVSCEVTPQHLTLYSPDCYDRLDTFAQMNPPIRSLQHQKVLWQGIHDRVVDVIGSDHAPHTRKEKLAGYPSSPSGMPGVQTLLGVMLHHVDAGRLSLSRLIELICEQPARHFSLNKGFLQPGYDADVIFIDPHKKASITHKSMAYKSPWTPFDGLEYSGALDTVIVGGKVMLRGGQVVAHEGAKAITRKP